MRVRRPRKHILVQPADELVRRIRQIPLHFLNDRAPLLRPLRRSHIHSPQARSLCLQRYIDVRCRNRRIELSNVLLRIRIILTAKLRIDRRGLVRRHPLTSAKRHMFQRMSAPRETHRRLVSTHHKVHLDGCNRRQRIGNDHYPKPIRQRLPDNSMTLSRLCCKRSHHQTNRRSP